MKTIKEHIQNVNESMMINEGLASKFLRRLAQQLQKQGSSFNGQIIQHINWSDVTNNDIKEYAVTPATATIIRNSFHNDSIMFCEKDDQVVGYFVGEVWHSLASHTVIRWQPDSKSTFRECVNFVLDKMDSIYIVKNDSRDEKRAQVHADRMNSRDNMIPVNDMEASRLVNTWRVLTPEEAKGSMDSWMRDFIRTQISRYKKEFAKLRADKDNDFAQIDKDVQAAFKRTMDLQSKFMSGDLKVQGSAFAITHLLEGFYGDRYQKYDRGILGLVAEYIGVMNDIKNGNASDIDETKKQLEECKRKIYDRIAKLDRRIADILG